MIHLYQKIPDFNPVSAGVRAAVRIPNGPTYRELVIKYSEGGTKANKATMIASIEEIKLKINGVARWEISGKHLVMLNEYYGLEFNDGELVIPLTRPWHRTIPGEENLAWGTKNVDTFFLEVKLAAGATNPELSCDAWTTPDQRDLGQIIEVHNYQYDTSTAGKKEIADLATGNGSLVALHLENANITNVELKVNRVPYIEDDTDLAAYMNSLERNGERVIQTGYVHIDALNINRVDDSWRLEGVQDFRINPTLSAAGNIPILMETLNQPLFSS